MPLSVKICSADRKVRKLLPLNPTDIAGFFELSVKSLVLILTKKNQDKILQTIGFERNGVGFFNTKTRIEL